MRLRTMVNTLRSVKNFKAKCMVETDTLTKCIFCKTYLSSHQWGKIIEGHIIHKFNMKKCLTNTNGDAVSKCKKYVEIKASLGDTTGILNYVQIRPDHKVDYYIFLAYDVYSGTIGKLYWFLIPSKKLYELIPIYGSYAHGTIDRLGQITSSNLKGRHCEYALRLNPQSKNNTKSKQLWDIFTQQFHKTEEDIYNILNSKC